MRFETLILLIIAFNVVTAVLQRRAKKAREARAKAGGDIADESGDREEMIPAQEREWGDPHRETPPPGTARRSPSARRSDARRRPDGPSTHSTHSTSSGQASSGTGGAEHAGAGRDILEKIARDLGLHFPRREAPPAPKPASVPAAAKKPAPVYGGSSREPAPAPRRSVAATESRLDTRPTPGIPFARLRGADRLREAVVLKEILDPPLSRRRR
jgi:hypothetical protein